MAKQFDKSFNVTKHGTKTLEIELINSVCLSFYIASYTASYKL